MIIKSDSCFASSNFVNHSYDPKPNWTPVGPIITISNAAWIPSCLKLEIWFYIKAFNGEATM